MNGGPVRVHHVIDGPPGAPVLVLSNSLGSTLDMWNPQIPTLGDRFRVVRYDLRGHGASPVPKGPYGIEDLGADVLALLDTLEVERAHMCGLSIGGQVAMWLAANAPERVGYLVLCCTSAHFGNERMWADRAALVRSRGTNAVAQRVVERWFTPDFARANPELVERMRAMVASTSSKGYAACCGVVERTDLRPVLASIRAPTLVIAGEQDRAVPKDQVEAMGSTIPSCRVQVVHNAAHLATMERADAVTELILDHLPGGEPCPSHTEEEEES